MIRRPGELALALAFLAAIGCGGGGGGAPSGSAGATGGAGSTGAAGTTGAGGSTGGGGAGNDAGTGTPPPICGNQTVEGTETCDGARGCPDGQVCADTCDACLPGYQPPPQTLGLIAAALAAGRIDYPTSLLLRGEALVADERLPPEYDGDFTTAEDSALFVELFSIWDNLTPAQQQMLLPYYVRPSDPQSVWSQPAPLADDLPDDMPPAIECPENASTGRADWRYTESPANHFVVWSCGGGDPTMDPYAAQRSVAAGLGDTLWGLETPGLGAPLADANSDGPAPTNRIDVYLLRSNESRYRNGQPNTIVGPALAAASPATPCGGTPATSSGFLMLRLEHVPTNGDAVKLGQLRSDFAHELFHVISYGRNLAGQGGGCGDQMVKPASGSWLTEASGVWAEWAYAADGHPSYRTDEFSVFQERYPFVDSLLEALATGVTSSGEKIDYSPAYEAFGYPVSLAGQSGKPDGFAAFWKSGTAGANTQPRLDDALDASFDFANHFRDFAVMDLNETLTGNPISPLFSALDPKAIMNGVKPFYLPMVQLFVTSEDIDMGVVTMPLASQNQLFNVPDSVRWVQIDASGADGSAHLALDALAYDKTKMTWTRRRPDAPVWTFCRDDAGDDISQLVLLLSNTGHHQADKIDSRYVIKTAEVCPAYLTGFVHSVQQTTEHDEGMGESTDEDERQVDNWTFSAPTGGATQLMIDASWNGSYEHHQTSVTTCLSGSAVQTFDTSGSGSGKTPLFFLSVGPMGYAVDLAGVANGSYEATEVDAYTGCDGTPGSSTSMHEVQDPYGTVQGYVSLMPGMDQPNHFVGSGTILHDVTPTNGGMQTVDWVVSWDVTLGRHN